MLFLPLFRAVYLAGGPNDHSKRHIHIPHFCASFLHYILEGKFGGATSTIYVPSVMYNYHTLHNDADGIIRPRFAMFFQRRKLTVVKV